MQISRRELLKVSAIAFIFIFGLTGCSSRPAVPTPSVATIHLSAFIANYGYIPLHPVRARHGAGTIVAAESVSVIIAGPDTDEKCFALRFDEQPVALLQQDYTVTQDAGTELDLGRLLGPNVNIAGAFVDQRVKSVKIYLRNPREVQIPQLTLVKHLRTLKPTNECKRAAFDPNNRLIQKALLLDGIDYSFLDSGGSSIKLDAKLLREIRIDASLREKWEGRNVLQVSFPVYVGVMPVALCELVRCDIASEAPATEAQREEVMKIILAKLGKYVDQRLFLKPNIPNQILTTISRLGLDPEEVLLVFDATLSMDATTGLILTATRAYWKSTLQPPESLRYQDMRTLGSEWSGLLINGKKVTLNLANDKAQGFAAMTAVLEELSRR